jgi:hypothetical protein
MRNARGAYAQRARPKKARARALQGQKQTPRTGAHPMKQLWAGTAGVGYSQSLHAVTLGQSARPLAEWCSDRYRDSGQRQGTLHC